MNRPWINADWATSDWPGRRRGTSLPGFHPADWPGGVLDDATTIWENWEGDLSQSHYSPGAVCQWLFDTRAGIRVDGQNHFTITQASCPGLERAGDEASESLRRG